VDFEDDLRAGDDELDYMRSISFRPNDRSGSLEGIPFVVKDAICVEGVETSAGSEILEGYKPVFNAAVVERLESSGAVFHGKTQQDEFGFGSFCTNCAHGTPRNPHDTSRVTGGSSGGAAAVCAATDKDVLSIGESTGGSITNPAAYNGVFGLTPTYGRVPRTGLVSYSNSLDKIGVLSSSLDLVAQGLEVVSGKDSGDQTSADRQVPEFSRESVPESLTVGVPTQLEQVDLEQPVRNNFEASLSRLENLGHDVERVDIPLLDPDVCVAAYYVMAVSEASTNLARFCGMRYGAEGNPGDHDDFNEYFSHVRGEKLGNEAKRRIILGTYARMAGYRDDFYVRAAKVRRKLIDQVEEAFDRYDLLAAPSMPGVAPTFEEAQDMSASETYAMDALTVGPNLAGVPQLSVPNGEGDGMPTGLQLIGPHWGEKLLIDTARQLSSE
jgi:Asp-tRNAAsn/Glu-tRNAGln amidotransferase A subunit and related amidases